MSAIALYTSISPVFSVALLLVFPLVAKVCAEVCVVVTVLMCFLRKPDLLSRLNSDTKVSRHTRNALLACLTFFKHCSTILGAKALMHVEVPSHHVRSASDFFSANARPSNVQTFFLMKNFFIITLISILTLTGCKSETEDFNGKALAFAKDGKIDQEEFGQLIGIVQKSSDRAFQQFKTDRNTVDSSKVLSYLLKDKRLNLAETDIWQPTASQKQETFNINVFIENSGSMNGYVNDPSTQFKNSVYSLLTRLKLFVNQDSLNLFFINQEDQLMFANASNADLEKFKGFLNPAAFSKISQGKTAQTDINQLIKRCLQKVNDRNLSVFISDCIYSPGKSKTDATMFLGEQKQSIYLHFASELKAKNSNLAVLILQLKGRFKGTYYDHQDNKLKFDNPVERPFYMWFIGTPSQIKKLIASRLLEELDGGYQNKAIFMPPNQESVAYRILPKPLHGTFDRTNLPNNIIEKPEPSRNDRDKGLFAFAVAADFSNLIQDPSYYIDSSNYLLSNPKYTLNIQPITDKNDPLLAKYTHLLKLQTKEISSETLTINLIAKPPKWIYEYSSDDDSKILSDASEQQKTFGLKYMLEGVSDAFYPKTHSNAIASIKIIIKK